MKTSTPLSSFLSELPDDLRDPSMLWQIGTLFFCVTLGWWLARKLRGAFAPDGARPNVVRLGVESLSSALSPLFILLLVVLAKLVLAQWQHVNLLRLSIPLVASFALVRFVFYILRRVFARAGRVGSSLLLFEKLFASLVFIGVVLYITGLWPELLQYMDETLVPLGRHKVSIAVILQAGISVAGLLMVALWAGTALEERLMQMDAVHSSMRVVMARMARAVLILISILVSLSMVGIDLTVLSVFGGALGVGLGLGLQKIASNYVSGFVILLDRSLAIGDVITVDKYHGKVTQINARYTVLLGGDGIESVIPNEMLVSGPVLNYSLTNSAVKLTAFVTIAYQSNIDEVFALLEQAAASVERVSQDPPPQASVRKFGNDGMELELGFWIPDLENGRVNVLSEVYKGIWRAMQANQITVPYPQREVRVIGKPDRVAEEAQ